MSFCETSCQPETPSSSPSACLSSSSPVMVRMAGTVGTHYVPLLGGPRDGTQKRRAHARGGRAVMRKGSLLVTDAPHLLYRAFFALPDSIKGADGQPVNAL